MNLPHWIGIALLTTLALGCSTGRIQILNPDGSSITVDQPPKAETPATLTIGETGVTISTGNSTPQTTLSENAYLIYIAGIGLVVSGGAMFALSFKFPLIPKSGSIGLAAIGVLVLFLPTVIEQAWWLLPLGFIILAVGWYANWRAKKKGLRT